MSAGEQFFRFGLVYGFGCLCHRLIEVLFVNDAELGAQEEYWIACSSCHREYYVTRQMINTPASLQALVKLQTHTATGKTLLEQVNIPFDMTVELKAQPPTANPSPPQV